MKRSTIIKLIRQTTKFNLIVNAMVQTIQSSSQNQLCFVQYSSKVSASITVFSYKSNVNRYGYKIYTNMHVDKTIDITRTKTVITNMSNGEYLLTVHKRDSRISYVENGHNLKFSKWVASVSGQTWYL